MNFLAHIYLSGDNDPLMIGNFIGDGIKGNRFDHLPPDMVMGVRMHRMIDSFTDSHEIFQKSCALIRPHMGKFAGVVVDMFYDHFLASGWDHFHPETIEEFTKAKYLVIQSHYDFLPPRFQRMTPYMTRENWLKSYALIDNVERALLGMTNRFNLPVHLPDAIPYLEQHYEQYKSDFHRFFPEITAVSNKFLLEKGYQQIIY